MTTPEYSINKYKAFEVRTIKIESDSSLLSGEYTLVEPSNVRDNFLVDILAKRFLQVASVVKTSPKNAVKKLSEVIVLKSLVIDFKGSLANSMMSSITGYNTRVYVWYTNKGTPIYVIPLDIHLYALAFETEYGNKYFVILDPEFIASGSA